LINRLCPFAPAGAPDPAVVGAVASSATDLEHVLPLPRPGGRKLFPTHRIAGLHRTGGVPALAAQTAALFGARCSQRPRRFCLGSLGGEPCRRPRFCLRGPVEVDHAAVAERLAHLSGARAEPVAALAPLAKRRSPN